MMILNDDDLYWRLFMMKMIYIDDGWFMMKMIYIDDDSSWW